AFDLGAALTNPGTAADLMLADRDQIIVFERYVPRELQLAPVLERLDHQARAGQPAKIVEVNGAVKLPGRYPLTRGATATDLIKAAGGLLDSSYTVTAEISRANTSDPNQASVDIFNVDLARAYTNAALDVAMQGRDVLTVKKIPDYAERLTVTLAGEVKFPGEYVVKKGDTLSQLIARAGGLTANAFPRGAVFTRERLKQLEAQRLKEAGERLQADLTAMELQGD